MSIRWIKIATDIFEDEKIKLIRDEPQADTIIVLWFELLSLAGRCNSDGVLMLNERTPYNAKMLATIFSRPADMVNRALDIFESYGMIEIVDGAITIPNWSKHQNSTGMEKIREQNKCRQAEFRSRQKKSISGEAEQPKQTEAFKAAESIVLEPKFEAKIEKTKVKKFVKPTIPEIEEYCRQRQNDVDAEKFFYHYESKGWMIGKSPMKDWKATVHTWEKERKKGGINDAGIKRNNGYDGEDLGLKL